MICWTWAHALPTGHERGLSGLAWTAGWQTWPRGQARAARWQRCVCSKVALTAVLGLLAAVLGLLAVVVGGWQCLPRAAIAGRRGRLALGGSPRVIDGCRLFAAHGVYVDVADDLKGILEKVKIKIRK